MIRTLVHSSNLRSIGHDLSSNVLEIEFQDGHVYQYLSVDAFTFAALMGASSKGSYFHERVKDRYVCRRVT